MIGNKKVVQCYYRDENICFNKGWKDTREFETYEDSQHEDKAIFSGMWLKNSEQQKVYHENAIIIIDLDFYKPKYNLNISEHPFIKEFGEDFVKDFNTYTVQTKSKGFHLYFNYDEDFQTTITDSNIHIDILSNNWQVATVGNLNGKYIVANEKVIKDIPENLSKWLKNNVGKKITKPLNTIEVKDVKIENDKELERICNNIDTQFIDNYRDWLKIVWACASIDNYELGKMISKKGSKWDETSYDEHYNRYEDGKGITKAVLYYYSKMSNQDKHFQIMKEHHKFTEIETPDDQEIALTFCKFYGQNFIINNGNQYYFNGVYWEAKSISNKIKMKIMEDMKSFYKKMILPNIEENEVKNKKIKKLIKFLGTNTKINQIVELIKVYITNDEVAFNEKPNIFCFKNKVYDLHKNEWIEPNKFDYISQSTKRPYIRPTKEKVAHMKEQLNRIFPIKEERDLYLTILATSLYGKTIEKFTVANGSGGNGKGYLNEMMLFMMGDYAVNADCSIILNNGKPRDGASPEMASLAEKRLVIMTEPNEKNKIDISTLKKITGGDTITARACYSNKTEHKIYITLIMECNKKPKMNGRMDKAILRRILDIPFRSTFTDDPSKYEGEEHIYQGDPNAKSVETKLEYYSSLFDILIEYWKKYQEQNNIIKIPKSIEKRNIEYMKSSDDILQFMESNYERTDNKEDYVKFKDVFQQYKFIVYKKMQRKDLLEKVNENEFLDFRKNKTIKGKKLESVLLGWKYKIDNDDDDYLFHDDFNTKSKFIQGTDLL